MPNMFPKKSNAQFQAEFRRRQKLLAGEVRLLQNLSRQAGLFGPAVAIRLDQLPHSGRRGTLLDFAIALREAAEQSLQERESRPKSPAATSHGKTRVKSPKSRKKRG